MNESRRHFLAGSGALAVGSMLPVSIFTKTVFAAQAEPWLYSRVESVAQMEGLAPFISMPSNSKVYLRQQATDFLKIRVEKHLSPVIKKLIGRTTLGAIAPVFMIIFDFIFPPDTPTWDEIKKEIDKRIEAALDKYEFEQIQKDFAALLDAYALRMESVKNNNSNISDETKWDLGHPQDWEALVNMCLKLKNYFYNNEKFNRHYEAAPLVSDFNFIYFMALNARLQCFKEGDDASTTVALMAQFLQGQYDYNVKLASIAYNEIHSSNDIDLSDTNPSFQWRVYQTYKHNAYTKVELSGYDKWDSIRWTHDMIRERIRLYHLLNTPVLSMCDAQSTAAFHFNKLFGATIPLARQEEMGPARYAAEMNRLQTLTPYSDGGGYSGLTLPGRADRYYNKGKDFSSLDAYVFMNNKSYQPGDYADLSDKTDPANPVYKYASKVSVPRGLVVIFYSEPNFGEYTKKGSNETLFKGKTHFYCEINYDAGTLPDFPVKSMKVRIDTASWFKNIKDGQIGRLPLLEYKKVNGYWTVGGMSMAEKP